MKDLMDVMLKKGTIEVKLECLKLSIHARPGASGALEEAKKYYEWLYEETEED